MITLHIHKDGGMIIVHYEVGGVTLSRVHYDSAIDKTELYRMIAEDARNTAPDAINFDAVIDDTIYLDTAALIAEFTAQGFTL